MHNHFPMAFLAKLLLLFFLVGSVAFAPVATHVPAASVHLVWAHPVPYPYCPPGPPCV